MRFIYGKWTEFIKCTDYESYEEYLKENPHKFRRSERSKSPNESPAHTPRKVLSKLNSLKMSSFRSLSIQEVMGVIFISTENFVRFMHPFKRITLFYKNSMHFSRRKQLSHLMAIFLNVIQPIQSIYHILN